jgi:hypothetical protein
LEASALQHASRLPALPGRSPLLRLQSDERLIAITRGGNQAAFETLVQRYQSRLLAFCRHMLGSTDPAGQPQPSSPPGESSSAPPQPQPATAAGDGSSASAGTSTHRSARARKHRSRHAHAHHVRARRLG